MNVTIEELPERRVATVRHVGPYARIPDAFERLDAIVESAGLRRHPDVTLLAIYYSDPETTPAAELQSDAGITVPAGVMLPPGLGETRLDGGRYARTTHVGPYTGLGDTWAGLIGQWLPKSEYRLRKEPRFEIYRNTPETAAPSKLRTDLYLPIA